MNLLRALPLILTCAVTFPVNAETSQSKDYYIPPESITKELSISSFTKNTVTFRLSIKSLIGTAKNVKLSAKVIGNDDLKPVPNILAVEDISEGKSASLDFILPITPKQAQDKSIKVQGDIEYLPDYEEIIKNIESNTADTYKNPVLKEQLIDSLKKNQENNLKSIQSTRFIPKSDN